SEQSALVLLDFLEFGVHDVVVVRLGLGGPSGLAIRRAASGALGGLHVGVHLLAQLLAGGHQGVGLGLDVVLVVALDGFVNVLDRGFDLFLFSGVQLVAVLGQGLAHTVDLGIALVLGLH